MHLPLLKKREKADEKSSKELEAENAAKKSKPKEAGQKDSEAEDEVMRERTGVRRVMHKKKEPEKKKLLDRLNEIGTVPQREIVEFTRHLAVMLTAGITIFEAVEFLKEQTKNKVFYSRLEKILENLGNGQTLSSSMKRFPKIFPDIYVNMVAIGEESGTLPKAMKDLANHLEEGDKFRKKVKGALIYPKIILLVMFAFIIVLVGFVMPRILTVFESLGSDIPTPTRVLMGTTNFINSHFIIIGILVFGVIGGIQFGRRSKATKKYFDASYLKAPVIGKIVLNYNTAQVSQHFGTLFASGITIMKCLQITQSVIQNEVFKKEIGFMVERIIGGASLSKSFPEKSNFPPMFIKLIKVGERTGQLPHVIEYMQSYYKDLVDNDVKNITTIIEPVIMVALGLMIAGLVVTVIGPIYQLISNVSG